MGGQPDGAIVVANPMPADEQLDPAEHDAVLADALAAAETARVVGHDSTPFLLDFVQQATHGRSLDVNVAVYRSNVTLGGAIARSLAQPPA